MKLIFPLPVIIISLLILSAISFFFSASETAVIGLSKVRLRHLMAKGKKGARSLGRLAAKLDRFISAILIGNNFVNIAISVMITAISVDMFGYHWGVIIATLLSTFYILIFCDISPKILATKHTERVALFSSPLMELLINIFRPIVGLFTASGNFIIRLLGITPSRRSPLVTEEELRMMIEIGKEEGVLTDEERRMLYRTLEFGDTKVRDVMIPQEKMVAIDIRASQESLLNLLVEQGHSRIPVFSGSIDNIVGIIYTRDLLYILRDNQLFMLQDLLHKPYYVNLDKRVNKLLRSFQAKRVQIAIVVDDKRRTVGLVTLEDLIEEIVGEIEEA
jgi:Mg2+/Co2+ transporter CorB